jgi:transitional endoplasmic reticulum ATPase
MRAGRFDFTFELPLPDQASRLEIFQIHTANMPLAQDIDFQYLAEYTEGSSGSDIAAICKHAMLVAMKRFISEVGSNCYDLSQLLIVRQDFIEGLGEVITK